MRFKFLLTVLFFSVIFLVTAKPVLAGCGPSKFSGATGIAYEPPFNICGKSAGGDDCCNTDPRIPAGKECPGTGVRCWPPFNREYEPGCQAPGYVLPPSFGPVSAQCDPPVCCKAKKVSSAGIEHYVCDTLPCPSGTSCAILSCADLTKWAAQLIPREYCEGTDYYDRTKKKCLAVSSSGWSQNIINCRTAAPGVPATSGVQTAIGCIPTSNLVDTGGFFLRWAFGAVGGVMLIMLIITGYSFMTSSGNPEKLQAVKENLVSILSGLILLGFSLVLLKAVGADILGLPGF